MEYQLELQEPSGRCVTSVINAIACLNFPGKPSGSEQYLSFFKLKTIQDLIKDGFVVFELIDIG